MDEVQLKTKRYMGFTDEKTKRVLDQHFNTYKYKNNYPDDYKFYRGAKYGAPSLFINPKKLERRSKDAHTIYYSLMDHLPSYKNYPSRSKSLIFTNTTLVAHEYSQVVYTVYPANNAKIAYSSIKDGFLSFPNIRKELNRSLTVFSYNMARLVSICSIIDMIPNVNADDDRIFYTDMDKYYNESHNLISDMNAGDMYKMIEKCGQILEDQKNRELVIKYVRYLDKTHKTFNFISFTLYFLAEDQSFIKTIDDLMDPTKNGIGLTTGVEIMDIYQQLPSSSELWTDGFCFLELHSV